jgi:hypothetical protein
MAQHCLGGWFRDFDHYEVLGGIQIVFAGFVYHSDVIVRCGSFVGQHNINLADLERFGIAAIIYAEGIPI